MTENIPLLRIRPRESHICVSSSVPLAIIVIQTAHKAAIKYPRLENQHLVCDEHDIMACV